MAYTYRAPRLRTPVGGVQPFQQPQAFGGQTQASAAPPPTAAPRPASNVGTMLRDPRLGGFAGGARGMLGGNFGGQAQDYLGQGQAAGYFNFDPTQSTALSRAREAGAIRRGDALRQRGSTAARLAGLNPYQAQLASMGIDQQAAGQTADFLSDAQLQEMMGNQDFLRKLFAGRLGAEDEERMLRLRAKLEEEAQGGGPWDILGDLLGMGAGSLIPGAGAFFGGGGGGGGGGSRMGSPGFRYPYGGSR